MIANETLFNTTTTTTTTDPNLTNEIANNLLIITIAISLIVTGISLNTMYLVAYWKRSIPNTHFNYCMFHLSIANLVQFLSYMPYSLVTTDQLPTTTNWVVESIMCATLRGLSLFWIGAITAGYMLCYMSSIKIILVHDPFQRMKITKKRTGRIFGVLWVLSVVQVSPFWFSKKLNGSHTKCIRDYHGFPTAFNIHDRIINFTGFFLPLITSLVTYTILIYHIYCRHHGDQETRHNRKRYRRRIITLLGIIITIFFVCWAPVISYWLIVATGLTNMDRRIYNYCTVPCLVAGTLNIVCSMNSKKSIKKLFCPFSKDNISISSTMQESTIREGYASSTT